MDYAIQFWDMCWQLMPHFLRGTNMRVWLAVMLVPMQSLNARFQNTVQDVRYKLGFTGQVLYLEHLLNDLFDENLRRVYIEDGVVSQPSYLYNKIEQRPLYLFNNSENTPLYIQNQAEYNAQFDFLVRVPASLLPAQDLSIRANVKAYKPAGRRFDVQAL